MSRASGSEVQDSDALAGAPHPRETTALFGHEQAEAMLLEAYRAGRLPHAWLIGGTEGIGKATLAWRFVRFLLAHPDPTSPAVARASDLSVSERDPARSRVAAGAVGDVVVLRREVNDKTGRHYAEIRAEDVRRATSSFHQASRAGGYRICLVDSLDDLNHFGANALLKLVEEPPPLSLFLLVAHRPAGVLPTLRSRCRGLALRPLSDDDLVRALQALGPPWSDRPTGELVAMATRAGGSVRAALRLGEEGRLGVDRDLRQALDRLPGIDWAALHRVADRLGPDPEDFSALQITLLDWLHDRMARETRGAPAPARLAPLAEVWENARRSARDAEALNLDKRSFLFATVLELARALPPP